MNDIHDMIQTCDLLPSEDVTRRLLDICAELNKRVASLEAKIATKESGYTCIVCGAIRPHDWFVYEIERDGQWFRPCCGQCAKQLKSRGPFPPMRSV